MECVLASGQYLVSVGLMSHVPYDAVLRSVEDIVQGNCQLHDSKTTGKMSGVAAQFVNEKCTQFLTQLRQLLQR